MGRTPQRASLHASSLKISLLTLASVAALSVAFPASGQLSSTAVDASDLATTSAPASSTEPDDLSLAGGTTGWACALNGCKYARAQIDWETLNDGGTIYRFVVRMRSRGATASGSCNPSNTITRWRATTGYVSQHSSGLVYYVASAGPWNTNCNINNSPVLTRTPGVSRPWDLRAEFNWCHQSSTHPSHSFQSRHWWVVHAGGPVSYQQIAPPQTC